MDCFTLIHIGMYWFYLKCLLHTPKIMFQKFHFVILIIYANLISSSFHSELWCASWCRYLKYWKSLGKLMKVQWTSHLAPHCVVQCNAVCMYVLVLVDLSQRYPVGIYLEWLQYICSLRSALHLAIWQYDEQVFMNNRLIWYFALNLFSICCSLHV